MTAALVGSQPSPEARRAIARGRAAVARTSRMASQAEDAHARLEALNPAELFIEATEAVMRDGVRRPE